MIVLQKLVVPPAVPLEKPAPGEWQTVQAAIGLRLPSDYRSFLEFYGSGCLDDFIWVFNPASKNDHLNLLTQLKVRVEALKSVRSACPSDVEYALFPEEGGLLPWGITENGDVLWWLCEGTAENWDIVVTESRGPLTQRFDMRMTEFLASMLAGASRCVVFPDDFPSDRPAFRPAFG